MKASAPDSTRYGDRKLKKTYSALCTSAGNVCDLDVSYEAQQKYQEAASPGLQLDDVRFDCMWCWHQLIALHKCVHADSWG